jgi:hypothetical protein
MVFGRSKSKQSESENLQLAYGNHDVADDESSVGASVPPPPPGSGEDAYNTYNGQMFQDEVSEDHDMSRGGYLDEERAASVEAQDVGVSMLSESAEDHPRRDPARRKKGLVIMTCILSFCVLVGVAVAYGRKDSNTAQSSSYSSLEGESTTTNSSLFNGTSVNGTSTNNTTTIGDANDPMVVEPSDETEFDPELEPSLNETQVDVSLNGTSSDDADSTDEPTSTNSTSEPIGAEVPEVEANATADPTAETSGTESPLSNLTDGNVTADSTAEPTGTESPLSNLTDGNVTADSTAEPTGTESPLSNLTDGNATADSTADPTSTESPLFNSTVNPTSTSEPSELSNVTFTNATEDFPSCIFNEARATPSCGEDGRSIVSIYICKPGTVTDEFWAWESAPENYQSFVDSDWNWLRAEGSTEIQRINLPNGPYTIGLFGQGSEDLVEYPLIVSADFEVDC